jgi:predicted RNase H-like HicB family nuclease
VENARDAVQQYIAALEEDQLPVPPETFDTLVVAV